MAKAEKFEDLFVWQEARALRKEIYKCTRKSEFYKDYETRGQIRNAALSVMNNIAEGFERGTNKEFAQFLNIAKGSVGEVRSILWAALDEEYISQNDFQALHEHCIVVSRRISKFITYLQNARPRPQSGDQNGHEDPIGTRISKRTGPRVPDNLKT
ncbi:MAG TPA: four helix bundle protein [Candidatus Saccharimonadales bacterium]|nr:four helix bundle protein [Candidatus Saccharimonadales bacterium]